LGLKRERISGSATAEESHPIPLDGQVLIWPCTSNLEEDVRTRLATSRVQVIPESSDGCLGWCGS